MCTADFITLRNLLIPEKKVSLEMLFDSGWFNQMPGIFLSRGARNQLEVLMQGFVCSQDSIL